MNTNTKNKRLFFGQFLVHKGLIQDGDVVEVLKIQQKKSPTFENIAARDKYLTMNQIFQLLTLQAESDLDFASVAKREGYLSEEDIRHIESTIEEKRPKFGEILAEIGKLPKPLVHDELEKYRTQVKHYLELAETLEMVQFFQPMRRGALETLACSAEIYEFKEGNVIVREGDDADSFYCVVYGELNVTKNRDGEEIYLATLGAYDVFGETAIFEKGHRTATVSAATDSTLLCFHRDDFMAFIKNHPNTSQQILLRIIDSLLQKLQKLNSELTFERKGRVSDENIDDLLDSVGMGTP